MSSTCNTYSLRLTAFDAQKQWAWCSDWQENQMSWFSICSIKLVTCTLSQKAKKTSLQFFPWCTALLTHFLGIGKVQNKWWHHAQWCSSWPNEQSTNQSSHKFSSEVMFWVIGRLKSMKPNALKAWTLCNQNDRPVLSCPIWKVRYQKCDLLNKPQQHWSIFNPKPDQRHQIQ